MDFTHILDLDSSAETFLSEWNNSNNYILAQTSGSTGLPKTISLLKDDMRLSAQATNRYFGLDCHSFLWCPLSCNYIAGKMMMVRAIESGCKISFAKELCKIPASLSGKNVTLLSVVPTQLRKLIDNDVVRNVETILIGGSPIPTALEKEIKSLGLSCMVSYGMTETCSHVALRQIGNQAYEALPGFDFSTDASERLIIHTPFNNSVCRLLRTNDIVSLIDSTHFVWKGRSDFAIITGGKKVFPEQIERKLSAMLPMDFRFYICGTPDPYWGTAVTLVIEKELEIPVDSLATLLPEERPKKIIVSPIEVTDRGKIIRKIPLDND